MNKQWSLITFLAALAGRQLPSWSTFEAIFEILPFSSIHTPAPLQPQYNRDINELRRLPERVAEMIRGLKQKCKRRGRGTEFVHLGEDKAEGWLMARLQVPEQSWSLRGAQREPVGASSSKINIRCNKNLFPLEGASEVEQVSDRAYQTSDLEDTQKLSGQSSEKHDLALESALLRTATWIERPPEVPSHQTSSTSRWFLSSCFAVLRHLEKVWVWYFFFFFNL